MDRDISRTVNYITTLLAHEGVLTDNVIAIMDDVLIELGIDDELVRVQIIQEAAIRVGLLRARDID